tara:strand:+ start:195 stop:1463 length:1269 start_codon:yes stop_codon:yes gene_type:complete
MATTNISTEIVSITGVTAHGASDDFIVSAQKAIVSSIPKELLKWAGSDTVPGTHGGDNSPTTVTLPYASDSILDVARNGFSAYEVPSSMKGFIGNSASLNAATETFPSYYITSSNSIVCKPDSSDSETVIVTYVDYANIDDDSDLRSAVVYHSCSSEFNKLATGAAPSDLTINAVAPSTPSVPSFTYTDVSVGDIVQPLISISDMASLSATAPAYTKPTFTTPVQSFDITQFETFLETEEDIELAQGQLGRLSHELGEYQANIGLQTSKIGQDIQNELNEFNKENVVYQEDVQRKAQNFQKEIQEAIQNAQSDLNVKSTNLNKDIQIALQNAIQDFQQDVQEYSAKIQKYNAELGAYQQEIGKEVQKYQNNLSLYSSKLNHYIQSSSKYYEMFSLQINMYIQNNSKIIGATIASQTAQQQGA